MSYFERNGSIFVEKHFNFYISLKSNILLVANYPLLFYSFSHFLNVIAITMVLEYFTTKCSYFPELLFPFQYSFSVGANISK